MSEKLRRINVRKDNRWLSILAGGTIMLVSLRPRGVWGILFALVGGELINRGLTGQSYVYTVWEFNNQPEQPRVIPVSNTMVDDDPMEAAPPKDRVQLASEQSFPASDPPSFTSTSL